MTFLKYTIGTLLASIFLAAPVFASLEPLKPSIRNEQPQEVVWVLSDAKIVSQVDKLESCETGGRNVSIIDTNGLESAGVLQFQFGTFVGYMERYNLAPQAEITDYRNLYRDTETQRYLAYKMLQESQENLYNWKNCAIDKGLI